MKGVARLLLVEGEDDDAVVGALDLARALKLLGVPGIEVEKAVEVEEQVAAEVGQGAEEAEEAVEQEEAGKVAEPAAEWVEEAVVCTGWVGG